jgi:stress response protein YsnF
MEEEQNLVIPLVEERVSATKREIEIGRVRVHTTVEEREEIVRAELARDTVEVERVPMSVEVSSVPETRQEGEVTVIPVVEEVLVVTKKLMLVEEIRLRRTRTVEEHARPVTLTRQRAEIERKASGGGHANPNEQ